MNKYISRRVVHHVKIIFLFVLSVRQTEVLKNGTVAAPATEKSATPVPQHPAAVNGTSSRAQRKHHKHDRTSKAQNNKPKVTKNKVCIIYI